MSDMPTMYDLAEFCQRNSIRHSVRWYFDDAKKPEERDESSTEGLMIEFRFRRGSRTIVDTVPFRMVLLRTNEDLEHHLVMLCRHNLFSEKEIQWTEY